MLPSLWGGRRAGSVEQAPHGAAKVFGDFYVLVLGRLRRRWDYAMVSRWSANPLG